LSSGTEGRERLFDKVLIIGRSVETATGEEAHRAAIESRMHAVAVELDLVQPFRTIRSRVDKLGQLQADPFG
jgi:hypothetical protein